MTVTELGIICGGGAENFLVSVVVGREPSGIVMGKLEWG